MQPYFLPYLGYFQLLAGVDKFVVYDDVNFINRGWVNRNRMLLNNVPHTFTVPLQQASQNKKICDLELVAESAWRVRLLNTIGQTYRKAPHYADVYPLVENVVLFETSHLDAFLLNSIKQIANYLGIRAVLVESSRKYANDHLKGQDRILDICAQERAEMYVNPPGGADLYHRQAFDERGVKLSFLRPYPIVYSQFNAGMFIENLSIMDVLMFNSADRVRSFLSQADFV